MTPKHRAVWTRAGWRSLLHRRYPRCVVRFGSDGAKLKLLIPEDEFNTNEIAQGRVPAKTLLELRKQAEAEWKIIQKIIDENKRRK